MDVHRLALVATRVCGLIFIAAGLVWAAFGAFAELFMVTQSAMSLPRLYLNVIGSVNSAIINLAIGSIVIALSRRIADYASLP